MNYTDLQTNIANYLHRADIADKVPGFIALAEAFIFRELQVKELELITTGTTTGEYADLPTDFGSVSRISVNTNGYEYSLDYKAQAESTTKAVPDTYALENNKLRIWGAGTGQAYTLYYTPRIEALSATVATNWILDNAHDLYFYASVLEGAKHVRNQGEIDKITPQIPMLLESVRNFARRKGMPNVGSLQIKPRR